MGAKILETRFFGINLVGVVASTLVFYLAGAIIYGLVFGRIWMGLTLASMGHVGAEEALAMSHQSLGFLWNEIFPDMNMLAVQGIGVVPVLISCVVLAWLVEKIKPESLLDAGILATIIWLGFAVTSIIAQVNYSALDLRLAGIDLLYTLIGYVSCAKIYYRVSFRRGNAIRQSVTVVNPDLPHRPPPPPPPQSKAPPPPPPESKTTPPESKAPPPPPPESKTTPPESKAPPPPPPESKTTPPESKAPPPESKPKATKKPAAAKKTTRKKPATRKTTASRTRRRSGGEGDSSAS